VTVLLLTIFICVVCTPTVSLLDVIKKKLPVINDEISKVLANVVDFEVFFESEGNKLDIFIKHPKYEARPIEMGSGAEKTIAAMAIRLALLICLIPPKRLYLYP
jgi:DNA repair exonuclease SbcCD ATPase subunit